MNKIFKKLTSLIVVFIFVFTQLPPVTFAASEMTQTPMGHTKEAPPEEAGQLNHHLQQHMQGSTPPEEDDSNFQNLSPLSAVSEQEVQRRYPNDEFREACETRYGCEFHDNGMVKVATLRVDDVKKDTIRIREVDEDGNETKITDTLNGKKVFEYMIEDGVVTHVKVFNQKGDHVQDNFYDASGEEIIEMWRRDSDGQVTEIRRFEWHHENEWENGIQAKEIYQDGELFATFYYFNTETERIVFKVNARDEVISAKKIAHDSVDGIWTDLIVMAEESRMMYKSQLGSGYDVSFTLTPQWPAYVNYVVSDMEAGTDELVSGSDMPAFVEGMVLAITLANTIELTSDTQHNDSFDTATTEYSVSLNYANGNELESDVANSISLIVYKDGNPSNIVHNQTCSGGQCYFDIEVDYENYGQHGNYTAIVVRDGETLLQESISIATPSCINEGGCVDYIDMSYTRGSDAGASGGVYNPSNLPSGTQEERDAYHEGFMDALISMMNSTQNVVATLGGDSEVILTVTLPENAPDFFDIRVNWIWGFEQCSGEGEDAVCNEGFTDVPVPEDLNFVCNENVCTTTLTDLPIEDLRAEVEVIAKNYYDDEYSSSTEIVYFTPERSKVIELMTDTQHNDNFDTATTEYSVSLNYDNGDELESEVADSISLIVYKDGNPSNIVHNQVCSGGQCYFDIEVDYENYGQHGNYTAIVVRDGETLLQESISIAAPSCINEGGCVDYIDMSYTRGFDTALSGGDFNPSNVPSGAQEERDAYLEGFLDAMISTMNSGDNVETTIGENGNVTLIVTLPENMPDFFEVRLNHIFLRDHCDDGGCPGSGTGYSIPGDPEFSCSGNVCSVTLEDLPREVMTAEIETIVFNYYGDEYSSASEFESFTPEGPIVTQGEDHLGSYTLRVFYDGDEPDYAIKEYEDGTTYRFDVQLADPIVEEAHCTLAIPPVCRYEVTGYDAPDGYEPFDKRGLPRPVGNSPIFTEEDRALVGKLLEVNHPDGTRIVHEDVDWTDAEPYVRRELHFDADGDLTQITYYSSNEEDSTPTKIESYEDGELVKEEFYDEDFNLIKEVSYEGGVRTVVTIQSDGILTFKIDSTNNVIEASKVLSDGTEIIYSKIVTDNWQNCSPDGEHFACTEAERPEPNEDQVDLGDFDVNHTDGSWDTYAVFAEISEIIHPDGSREFKIRRNDLEATAHIKVDAEDNVLEIKMVYDNGIVEYFDPARSEVIGTCVEGGEGEAKTCTVDVPLPSEGEVFLGTYEDEEGNVIAYFGEISRKVNSDGSSIRYVGGGELHYNSDGEPVLFIFRNDQGDPIETYLDIRLVLIEECDISGCATLEEPILEAGEVYITSFQEENDGGLNTYSVIGKIQTTFIDAHVAALQAQLDSQWGENHFLVTSKRSSLKALPQRYEVSISENFVHVKNPEYGFHSMTYTTYEGATDEQLRFDSLKYYLPGKIVNIDGGVLFKAARQLIEQLNLLEDDATEEEAQLLAISLMTKIKVTNITADGGIEFTYLGTKYEILADEEGHVSYRSVVELSTEFQGPNNVRVEVFSDNTAQVRIPAGTFSGHYDSELKEIRYFFESSEKVETLRVTFHEGFEPRKVKDIFHDLDNSSDDITDEIQNDYSFNERGQVLYSYEGSWYEESYSGTTTTTTTTTTTADGAQNQWVNTNHNSYPTGSGTYSRSEYTKEFTFQYNNDGFLTLLNGEESFWEEGDTTSDMGYTQTWRDERTYDEKNRILSRIHSYYDDSLSGTGEEYYEDYYTYDSLDRIVTHIHSQTYVDHDGMNYDEVTYVINNYDDFHRITGTGFDISVSEIEALRQAVPYEEILYFDNTNLTGNYLYQVYVVGGEKVSYQIYGVTGSYIIRGEKLDIESEESDDIKILNQYVKGYDIHFGPGFDYDSEYSGFGLVLDDGGSILIIDYPEVTQQYLDTSESGENELHDISHDGDGNIFLSRVIPQIVLDAENLFGPLGDVTVEYAGSMTYLRDSEDRVIVERMDGFASTEWVFRKYEANGDEVVIYADDAGKPTKIEINHVNGTKTIFASVDKVISDTPRDPENEEPEDILVHQFSLAEDVHIQFVGVPRGTTLLPEQLLEASEKLNIDAFSIVSGLRLWSHPLIMDGGTQYQYLNGDGQVIARSVDGAYPPEEFPELKRVWRVGSNVVLREFYNAHSIRYFHHQDGSVTEVDFEGAEPIGAVKKENGEDDYEYVSVQKVFILETFCPKNGGDCIEIHADALFPAGFKNIGTVQEVREENGEIVTETFAIIGEPQVVPTDIVIEDYGDLAALVNGKVTEIGNIFIGGAGVESALNGVHSRFAAAELAVNTFLSDLGDLFSAGKITQEFHDQYEGLASTLLSTIKTAAVNKTEVLEADYYNNHILPIVNGKLTDIANVFIGGAGIDSAIGAVHNYGGQAERELNDFISHMAVLLAEEKITQAFYDQYEDLANTKISDIEIAEVNKTEVLEADYYNNQILEFVNGKLEDIENVFIGGAGISSAIGATRNYGGQAIAELNGFISHMLALLAEEKINQEFYDQYQTLANLKISDIEIVVAKKVALLRLIDVLELVDYQVEYVSVGKEQWFDGCVGWDIGNGGCTDEVIDDYIVVLRLASTGKTYEFHAGIPDPAIAAEYNAVKHFWEETVLNPDHYLLNAEAFSQGYDNDGDYVYPVSLQVNRVGNGGGVLDPVSVSANYEVNIQGNVITFDINNSYDSRAMDAMNQIELDKIHLGGLLGIVPEAVSFESIEEIGDSLRMTYSVGDQLFVYTDGVLDYPALTELVAANDFETVLLGYDSNYEVSITVTAPGTAHVTATRMGDGFILDPVTIQGVYEIAPNGVINASNFNEIFDSRANDAMNQIALDKTSLAGLLNISPDAIELDSIQELGNSLKMVYSVGDETYEFIDGVIDPNDLNQILSAGLLLEARGLFGDHIVDGTVLEVVDGDDRTTTYFVNPDEVDIAAKIEFNDGAVFWQIFVTGSGHETAIEAAVNLDGTLDYQYAIRWHDEGTPDDLSDDTYEEFSPILMVPDTEANNYRSTHEELHVMMIPTMGQQLVFGESWGRSVSEETLRDGQQYFPHATQAFEAWRNPDEVANNDPIYVDYYNGNQYVGTREYDPETGIYTFFDDNGDPLHEIFPDGSSTRYFYPVGANYLLVDFDASGQPTYSEKELIDGTIIEYIDLVSGLISISCESKSAEHVCADPQVAAIPLDDDHEELGEFYIISENANEVNTHRLKVYGKEKVVEEPLVTEARGLFGDHIVDGTVLEVVDGDDRTTTYLVNPDGDDIAAKIEFNDGSVFWQIFVTGEGHQTTIEAEVNLDGTLDYQYAIRWYDEGTPDNLDDDTYEEYSPLMAVTDATLNDYAEDYELLHQMTVDQSLVISVLGESLGRSVHGSVLLEAQQYSPGVEVVFGFVAWRNPTEISDDDPIYTDFYDQNGGYLVTKEVDPATGKIYWYNTDEELVHEIFPNDDSTRFFYPQDSNYLLVDFDADGNPTFSQEELTDGTIVEYDDLVSGVVGVSCVSRTGGPACPDVALAALPLDNDHVELGEFYTIVDSNDLITTYTYKVYGKTTVDEAAVVTEARNLFGDHIETNVTTDVVTDGNGTSTYIVNSNEDDIAVKIEPNSGEAYWKIYIYESDAQITIEGESTVDGVFDPQYAIKWHLEGTPDDLTDDTYTEYFQVVMDYDTAVADYVNTHETLYDMMIPGLGQQFLFGVNSGRSVGADILQEASLYSSDIDSGFIAWRSPAEVQDDTSIYTDFYDQDGGYLLTKEFDPATGTTYWYGSNGDVYHEIFSDGTYSRYGFPDGFDYSVVNFDSAGNLVSGERVSLDGSRAPITQLTISEASAGIPSGHTEFLRYKEFVNDQVVEFVVSGTVIEARFGSDIAFFVSENDLQIPVSQLISAAESEALGFVQSEAEYQGMVPEGSQGEENASERYTAELEEPGNPAIEVINVFGTGIYKVTVPVDYNVEMNMGYDTSSGQYIWDYSYGGIQYMDIYLMGDGTWPSLDKLKDPLINGLIEIENEFASHTNGYDIDNHFVMKRWIEYADSLIRGAFSAVENMYYYDYATSAGPTQEDIWGSMDYDYDDDGITPEEVDSWWDLSAVLREKIAGLYDDYYFSDRVVTDAGGNEMTLDLYDLTLFLNDLVTDAKVTIEIPSPTQMDPDYVYMEYENLYLMESWEGSSPTSIADLSGYSVIELIFPGATNPFVHLPTGPFENMEVNLDAYEYFYIEGGGTTHGTPVSNPREIDWLNFIGGFIPANKHLLTANPDGSLNLDSLALALGCLGTTDDWTCGTTIRDNVNMSMPDWETVNAGKAAPIIDFGDWIGAEADAFISVSIDDVDSDTVGHQMLQGSVAHFRSNSGTNLDATWSWTLKNEAGEVVDTVTGLGSQVPDYVMTLDLPGIFSLEFLSDGLNGRITDRFDFEVLELIVLGITPDFEDTDSSKEGHQVFIDTEVRFDISANKEADWVLQVVGPSGSVEYERSGEGLPPTRYIETLEEIGIYTITLTMTDVTGVVIETFEVEVTEVAYPILDPVPQVNAPAGNNDVPTIFDLSGIFDTDDDGNNIIAAGELLDLSAVYFDSDFSQTLTVQWGFRIDGSDPTYALENDYADNSTSFALYPVPVSYIGSTYEVFIWVSDGVYTQRAVLEFTVVAPE